MLEDFVGSERNSEWDGRVNGWFLPTMRERERETVTERKSTQGIEECVRSG